MVKRNWSPKDIKKAFFQVDERRVAWVDNRGSVHAIPGQKALIDADNGNTFAVVSNQYYLIHNEEAYNYADFVIQGVFDGLTLKDFEVFNIHMPKTKSFCRIDLIVPNSPFKAFGDERESYTPFVRISNSYNRSIVLKYEIGFCRWICLNGCIFGQKGVTFSITHNEKITVEKIGEWISRANKDIGKIGDLWNAFETKLKQLKSISLPQSVVLPMFCKAFGIKISEKEMTDKKKEILSERANLIVNAGKEYFKELGNNAYALYNVLTDFASYPAGGNESTSYSHGFQHKVGAWVDSIVTESKEESFSLHDFIGKEAMDSAYYLESLIK